MLKILRTLFYTFILLCLFQNNAISQDLFFLFPQPIDKTLFPEENNNTHRCCLGPLFVFDHRGDKTGFVACPRPFFTYCYSEERQEHRGDIMWPFGGWRIRSFEDYKYFYPFFYTGSIKDNKTYKYRFGIFPLFCHGVRENKERYTMLFPIGGSMDNIAGADNFKCILFPIWTKTTNHNKVSYTILWPLYKRTCKNNKVTGQSFLPFYGYSITKNSLNEFILWPFFTKKTGIFAPGFNLKQDGFFFFPFYGRSKTTNKEGDIFGKSTTFLWPFFTFENKKSSKGAKYERKSILWPFYNKVTEIDNNGSLIKEKFFSWPLYGKTKYGESLKDTFMLYPLFFNYHAKSDKHDYQSKRVCLIYHNVISEYKEANKIDSTLLWPLFNHKNSQKDNASSLNILALWPTTNVPDTVQRNWEPLWSIYHHYNSPEEFHQKILWGIWEYQKKGTNSTFELWPIFKIHNSSDKKNTKKTKFSFLFNIFSIKF